MRNQNVVWYISSRPVKRDVEKRQSFWADHVLDGSCSLQVSHNVANIIGLSVSILGLTVLKMKQIS